MGHFSAWEFGGESWADGRMTLHGWAVAAGLSLLLLWTAFWLPLSCGRVAYNGLAVKKIIGNAAVGTKIIKPE